MITDGLIHIVGLIITLPLRLLPLGITLPPEVLSAFEFIVKQGSAWDALLPVRDLVVIVGLILTFEVAAFGFRSLNWVINKIRGSGG
jgi:hypothetical protein